MCAETTSYTERYTHTTLVKGLVDNETKCKVLSKVALLTLDVSIVFMKARKTRQRALAGLSGSALASQQVHAVRDFL